MPSCRAAAEKLPRSTTSANTAISGSRPISLFVPMAAQFLFRNQIINTRHSNDNPAIALRESLPCPPTPLHQRYPFLPDLVLLLVAMVWGSSYGLAKQALLFYPVLGLLALRFGLTFILLLPAQRALADAATRRATCWRPCRWAGPAGHFPVRNRWRGPHQRRQCGLPDQPVPGADTVCRMAAAGQKPADALLAAAVSLLGAWLLSGAAQLQLNGGDLLMLLAAVLRALVTSLTRR
jgi:hypothetical protein